MALVTVNVQVCADSLVGPALRLVRKLALVIMPASSAITTRLVLRTKDGASFTAVTVNNIVLVTESEPSEAVTVIVADPLAFATGANVRVRLVPEPLMATVARLVSADVAVVVKLLESGSEIVKVEVRFVVASSRMVLLVRPTMVGASLTAVTTSWRVFVKVSTPPLAVPPLSFITTVRVFVPLPLVPVMNVSVPLVAMAGATA